VGVAVFDSERTALAPLELLWEPAGLPSFELPAALAELYPGTLGFEAPRVFANFVETIDGVVAIPSVPSSNALVAGGSEADRFVLGLLRSCADCLVIGSGTQAASPRSVWSTEQAYPPAAAAFAELRERLGRPRRLQIAVLTRTGRVDPSHPAFAVGGLALTTDEGAARLALGLAEEQIVSLGEELAPEAAIAALRERGHELILCEGGPHAIGPFVAAGLVDELFLTISPLLAGRVEADPRYALVEGTDLLPAGPPHAGLIGVRRDGDHLFLRYELDGTDPSHQ
jgi:riboflavin biosynthesis pyrimidine reductase